MEVIFGRARLSVSLLLLFLLCIFSHVAAAGGKGHAQHHHAHGHHHQAKRIATQNATLHGLSRNNTGTPEELVELALQSLRELNKERVLNPSFNKQEFANQTVLASAPSLAPPLIVAELEGSIQRRHNVSSATGSAAMYSIPGEIAEAARVVAEMGPQVPSGNHASMAAEIKVKYKLDTNDTNVPEQHQRPEGLLGIFGTDSEIQKRGHGYWMVDMEQLGSAPYAEPKYRVWRNVKDYGAKGDGTTDDTKAINLAISDGARCGQGCGSSTIKPAVIYFPPGTYLVSSPIVQYFNTQFLGHPYDMPTILAAKSFVGLGVVTSDVYIANNEQWYLNTANFLRSIRNFKIDIRLTDPRAYICAIHWQVAQATSLENIEFYMLYNTDVPENTQQGIYMENGSGGFLADLTFVGGNFGAYFGNQQFTTSHLVFVKCDTAVQVHWDWAWTMQDYVIESCNNGLVVVGGAGAAAEKPDNQGVGSLILTDAVIANTQNGIITTLKSDRATSFLMQNVGFFNVQTAVLDKQANQVLVKGGSQVILDSWGFGLLNNATGKSSRFVNGAEIPSMNRPEEFLGTKYDKMKPNLFTRRRPTYYNEPQSNVLNVKALGAKGDGTSDDTAVLNAILQGAANTSSIVYFPYGVYVVRDTLRVPLGSRIIGQIWSQIMGRGKNFEDELSPRPVVQVGRPGDIGIVEIQDMMFTVGGPTAGAVVVEWNVEQKSQGSAGMWDTHIRVGGAAGSDLSIKQCPKLPKGINNKCKAASLLMHLKPNSTAYIENMWAWVADHDLDQIDLPQVDIYAGRGILVQSKLAYLWGTASEHAVMYQYQLAGASKVLMGMIQTESPYFQPTPRAPEPFQTGLFPKDPNFADCEGSSKSCAVSWAVRIVDSTSVYILGAGIYSWFQSYDQKCVKTEDCQVRGFEVEEAYDIWIYNLCTKAIVEMISPKNSLPTLAKDNVNGFLSSILGWLQGAKEVTGRRKFEGFTLYEPDFVDSLRVPETCKNALKELVICDDFVSSFQTLTYRGSLNNNTLTNSVCDKECKLSVKSWIENVERSCLNVTIAEGPATVPAEFMRTGVEETCLKDKDSDKYCNDIIDGFTIVPSIDKMPTKELCSFCNVERLAMMQRTPYSVYDEEFKSQLEYVNAHCSRVGDTSVPSPLFPQPEDSSCGFDNWFTVAAQRTCDSVAADKKVSSAALFMANSNRLHTCGSDDPIEAGTKLCLPTTCDSIYQLKSDNETCNTIEANLVNNMKPGDVRKYNAWVGYDCRYLTSARHVYGNTICLGPQGGGNEPSVNPDPNTVPARKDGYVTLPASPPQGATVAINTTLHCGKWHVAEKDDTCAGICMKNGITSPLLLEVNPSLGTDALTCSNKLKSGFAYCVGPNYDWKDPYSNLPDTALYEAVKYGDGKDWRLDTWSKYGDGFDASKERLAVQSSAGGKATVNIFDYSDFVMETVMNLESGPGDANAGLIFRTTNLGVGPDNYNGYYVGIDRSGSVFLGRSNGGWAELARTKMDGPPSRSHRIKVEAVGDRIVVYVDNMGKPKLNVTDSTYRSGSYGVRVYNIEATYNSLQITPIWHDNFDDGTMSHWTTYGGSFTAKSKALVAQSSFGSKATVDEVFTQFSLEADIVVKAGKETNAGLLFRVSDVHDGVDSYNGYYIGVGASGFVVLGRAKQDWTQLSRVQVSIEPGQVHHLKVKAFGERILVFVDNMINPVIDMKDSTYSTGKIGVRVFQTDATFDNIKVVPITTLE